MALVSTRKLTQWMAADQAAHASSRRLLQRRLAYLHGHGPEPGAEEVEEVERLRAEASRLYSEARQEVEGAA
jgi:hypothetical protein